MARAMTLNEAWNMSYDEYVQYLLDKYGGAKYDYFRTRECRSISNVTRGYEGLECHHIDENKYILLCEPHFARKHWETQTADRLVYANKIEHVLLHIKIANMGTAGDYMCGTMFLVGSTNSMFEYPPIERELKPYEKWELPMYERIKDNFDLYIEVLHRLSQLIYEQNASERDLVRNKKISIKETTAYKVVFSTNPNSKNIELPKKVYNAFLNHVSKEDYEFAEVLDQQVSIEDLLEQTYMDENNKYIIYHGIPCEIIEDYLRPGDGPYLKIKSYNDIDKAYSLGFTCMGYPDEIMKKIDWNEIQ